MKANIATQRRFTSKERDSETGLDYFGARYYGSSLGRFMTPDWASAPEAVPFAAFAEPQSLNQYSYVRNNVVTRTDPDGHCDSVATCVATFAPAAAPVISTAIAGAAAAGTAVVASAYVAFTRISDAYVARQNDKALSDAVASENTAKLNNKAPVPPGLVGTQDDKSGQAGDRWKSGPLAPEHGGTGNASEDFDKLTGGKSNPAPTNSNYPQGTRIGEDGTALRPETEKAGPRIDIPAKDDKPHETLHYPKQG